MEPLHLTEENRAAIRDFVNAHFPGEVALYRDDEKERVRAELRRAVEREEAKAAQDLAAVTRRAFGAQMAVNIYNTSPLFQQLVSNTTTSPLPPTVTGAWNEAAPMKPGPVTWGPNVVANVPPTYVPFGSVFDTYTK